MINDINDGAEIVNCILDYEDACTLIQSIVSKFNIRNLELEIMSPDLCGYMKEYIVTLDDERDLYCEKAYSEDHKRYLAFESDCTYIMEYCNSKCLSYCDDDANIFVICIPDEELDTVNCEDCEFKDECIYGDDDYSDIDVDDDMHGFTTSWSDGDGSYSLSFHSTDKEYVEDMMKVFVH